MSVEEQILLFVFSQIPTLAKIFRQLSWTISRTFEQNHSKQISSIDIGTLYCRSALLRFNVLLQFMTAPLAALLHESSISKEDRKESDIIMLLYGTRTAAAVIYRDAYRARQSSSSLAHWFLLYICTFYQWRSHQVIGLGGGSGNMMKNFPIRGLETNGESKSFGHAFSICLYVQHVRSEFLGHGP